MQAALLSRNRFWAGLVRAPFAAVIYCEAAYVGVNIFTSLMVRKVLGKVLPEWEIYTIAVMLIFGGLFSLYGMVTRNQRFERAGLSSLSVGLVIYSTTALIRIGVHNPNAWFDYALALAAAIRFVVLGVVIKARVVAAEAATAVRDNG